MAGSAGALLGIEARVERGGSPMKKLLLILALMVAGAFVVTLVRSRKSGSDALSDDWSTSAAALRSKATEAASKLSESAKEAATVVKEKAAEAKDVIKDKAQDASSTIKDAAQDARS
jgi:hypothetical protein